MRFFLFFSLSFLFSYSFITAQEANQVDKILDTINVKKHGVLGDGISDDWVNIQKLVDSLANKEGGVLFFPNGTYVIRDKTLLLLGKNITLNGESRVKTILEKRGRAGWWGELIAISGKTRGGKYYGSFGKSEYDRFMIYEGNNVPSNNISLNSFTFRTKSENISEKANNIGIFNANGIKITNCTFSDAPQSNLAIVNNTSKSENKSVYVSNCTFQNSGKHNVRVISYNQGNHLGNDVTINNCNFCKVRGVDTLKEIKGKKVHLWYRAGSGSDAIRLKVNKCNFDETGAIISTVNASNFTLEFSKVKNEVELASHRNYKNGEIKLIGNEFDKEVFVSNKVKLLWKDNISKDHSKRKKVRTYQVQDIIN